MKIFNTILLSITLSTSLLASSLQDGEIIYETAENQELLDSMALAETIPMDTDTSEYDSISYQERYEQSTSEIQEIPTYPTKTIGTLQYGQRISLKDDEIIYQTAENQKLLDSIPLAKTIPMDADISTYQPTNIKKEKIVNKKKKIGKLAGHIKLLHVADGKDNGYDINTGSTYYGTANYTTPEINGVSATVGAYVVGDTGLTETGKDDMVANGQFMGKKTKDKSTVLETKVAIQETYVKYKGDSLKAQAGHFKLNTPMTRNSVSTVPNLYEGVVISSDKVIDDTTIVGSHITKIAYGARSISDWGKIGEKTTTAGSIGVYSVDEEITELAAGDQSLPKSIRRGEYTNIGKISGKDNMEGMTVVGAINKSIKNTTLQAWEYIVYDVANVTYIDGMTKYKLSNGVKTMLGAQLIHENIQNSDDTPTLVGAKAAIAYKGSKLIVAVNKSNGDAMLNIWGGDPAYTSTLFSKNAYRPDVTAVKFAGSYKIPNFNGILPKNLSLNVAHARYSQSSLKYTQKAATETDIALKYKVSKNLLLKVANVQRESEFDGFKGKDKTQNMTKFVMVYKF